MNWRLCFFGMAVVLTPVGLVALEGVGAMPAVENPVRWLFMVPVLVGVACMRIASLGIYK